MMPDQKDFHLGPLADPMQFRQPVDPANESSERLRGWLRDMLRIRMAEEAIADLVVAGEARCPCHLAIGQEAVAVGVSAALTSADRVYGGHRSHAHYLAMGADMRAMFAEILGKDSGASRGMGGSMHLYAPDAGFHGSVPIVGATIPVAVGAALAAKMDRKGAVAVAYFGDGACEEGVLHECLNLASMMKLPVIFVVENNLYASHLDIALRQPYDSVTRFAVAHRIESASIDGNDVVKVAHTAGRLVENARRGGGPAFLEAVTYRWRGHVGPSEDIDVGVRRKAGDLDLWKQRDPVARLEAAITGRDGAGSSPTGRFRDEIRAEIADALAFGRSASYPQTSRLMDYVYAPASGQRAPV
jgi:TPP-dependent pyruvate/acetoin dehydrogenase alpha subunit